MGVVDRFNVTVSGRPDGQPMVFAHGFGCDQHMWRDVSPRFEDEFRVVLFDYVGAGGSDWPPMTRTVTTRSVAMRRMC
jgi:sigma-B regulation protein RsbQ